MRTSLGPIVLGSIEFTELGAAPRAWALGSSESQFWIDEAFDLAVLELGNGGAMDLVELPAGGALVLGWQDTASGPETVVWRVGPDGVSTIDHVFDADLFGGRPHRIELDEDGRAWIVATRGSMDGSVDIAVLSGGNWVTTRVNAGFVTNVQSAAFDDRLVVWSAGELVDEFGRVLDQGWVARSFTLDGDVIAVYEEVIAGPETIMGEIERVGDDLVVPMTSGTGESVLWRSPDGVIWDRQDVAIQPGSVVRAVVQTTSGLVVLVGGRIADPASGMWAFETLVERADGFEPWSAPFQVDTLATAWTNDVLAEPFGDGILIIDRPHRASPVMTVVSETSKSVSELDFPVDIPSTLQRVSHLLESPLGPVAVVTTWNEDGASWRTAPGQIYVFSEGRWRGVANALVNAAAMWGDRPVFSIDSGAGVVEWHVLDGLELQPIGSTDELASATDMEVVGDVLTLAGWIEGRRRLLSGPIAGPLSEPAGFPSGHDVVDLCSNASRVYAVVESRVDGRRRVLTIVDGVIDPPTNLSIGLRDPTFDLRAPLCWVNDGSVGVMGESTVQAGTTAPLVEWLRGDAADESFSLKSHFSQPGSSPHGAAANAFITNVVGVAHDHHGSMDAVWWTVPAGGQLSTKMVFGGNGRQEADSLLRVDDGWLIGGTDNGEPLIWIVRDD